MKTKDDLFLQLWLSPIINGDLLTILDRVNLHTFIGLSAYVNKFGQCDPSLKSLKRILGLKDIGSVSRRIKKLENIKFKNNPLLKVERGRERNKKGILVYARNKYILNREIITIFAQSTSTSSRRIEQMEKFQEIRSKLTKSIGMNAKRVQ